MATASGQDGKIRESTMSNDGYERPWRTYWRVLYPEWAHGQGHWYGKWKTSEMCMGLYDARQSARFEWPRNAQGEPVPHPTAVVTFHASSVRSITAKVCLQCLWVSRDLNAPHDESQGS